jgi:hypothetical protein
MVSKALTQPFQCAETSEPNLKILAVGQSHNEKTSWGAHMEILGIAGFVFAATAAGVLVYERETDVLHGPYIEGRQAQRAVAAMLGPVRPVIEAVTERLNWRARNAVYLASFA